MPGLPQVHIGRWSGISCPAKLFCENMVLRSSVANPKQLESKIPFNRQMGVIKTRTRPWEANNDSTEYTDGVLGVALTDEY